MRKSGEPMKDYSVLPEALHKNQEALAKLAINATEHAGRSFLAALSWFLARIR